MPMLVVVVAAAAARTPVLKKVETAPMLKRREYIPRLLFRRDLEVGASEVVVVVGASIVEEGAPFQADLMWLT